MIPLFVLPVTLLVVLVSSKSGDQNSFAIAVLYRPPPLRDRRRAGTVGNHFARDDKEDPGWGKQLPGERPREITKTRHTSHQPSRYVRRKGADPLMFMHMGSAVEARLDYSGSLKWVVHQQQ
jgi:hypothetical protein